MSGGLRALALALLLLAPAAIVPGAAATEAPPAFPAPYLDILRSWVEDAAADERSDRPWAKEVDRMLANATRALDAGRFTMALGHYEAALTLERTHRFMDRMENETTSARRAELLRLADADVEAGEDAFGDFRRALDSFEGNVTSLKAFEGATFVAHVAADRAVVFDHYRVYRRALVQGGEVDEAVVYSTFSMTTPPSVVMPRLAELLDAAQQHEGRRPVLLKDPLDAMMDGYGRAADRAREPALVPYAKILRSAVNANETALALGSFASMTRASSNHRIALMYTDAQSRHGNVTDLLRENFGKALEETDPAPAQEFGLLGLFILTALDEGAIALDRDSTLNTLTYAWAAQKAAIHVTNDLSLLSPEKPEAKTEGDDARAIPVPALGLLVAGMGAAALAVARRRR